MPNTNFMMTLDQEVVNYWKQQARERNAKEHKDYTFQDIVREILLKAYAKEGGK